MSSKYTFPFDNRNSKKEKVQHFSQNSISKLQLFLHAWPVKLNCESLKHGKLVKLSKFRAQKPGNKQETIANKLVSSLSQCYKRAFVLFFNRIAAHLAMFWKFALNTMHSSYRHTNWSLYDVTLLYTGQWIHACSGVTWIMLYWPKLYGTSQ